ncbi:MAG: SpoIID/LytB domain-containing protein [Candidatus Sericytochromatia bacterium]
MNLRISTSLQALFARQQSGPVALRPSIKPDAPAEIRDRLHVAPQIQLMGPVPSGSIFASQESWLQEMQKVKQVTPSLAELPDFGVTPLRIGVGIGLQTASFSFEKGQLWVDTPEGSVSLGAFENARFQITAQPGGFQLTSAEGQDLGHFTGVLRLDGNDGPVSINGSRYRGSLEIRPHPENANRFNLINTVMLEDYLLSVVPSESPASWPIESLKAQAMAARTYAVANWRKREALGFDMNADTSDQMYTGIQGEQPASSVAVKATQNQIIAFQGKPITALFFSSSGGSTDSAKEVWGVDLPYIQPVKDFDQAAPRYRWEKTMTPGQVQTALTKLGVNVGSLRKIEILETTPQGRVKQIRFSGSTGSAEVDANKFRFAAGLSSTRWTVAAEGQPPRSFRFDGGGWGHGLGMSQWGARQMAADGKNASEIIHHYYTGVEIQALKAEDPALGI